MYTVYCTHLSVRPFCTYINLRIGRACVITESCDCFNFKAKVRYHTRAVLMYIECKRSNHVQILVHFVLINILIFVVS